MHYFNLVKVNRNDLVLEVGPGGSPFWRSNILIDKYDNDDRVPRGNFGQGRLRTKGKPFYKIINNKIPFPDNAFNYAICSHVLEHVPVEELEILIAELFRVSPRVYIEFPAPLYDILFNFEAHLNLLDIVQDEVICISKTSLNINNQTFFNYIKTILLSDPSTLKKIPKYFLTIGKEFDRDNFKINILSDENEFFRRLYSKDYFPESPSFTNKVLKKVKGIIYNYLFRKKWII
jgi:hypothetical protein